jgi:hypothetical protein
MRPRYNLCVPQAAITAKAVSTEIDEIGDDLIRIEAKTDKLKKIAARRNA